LPKEPGQLVIVIEAGGAAPSSATASASWLWGMVKAGTA